MNYPSSARLFYIVNNMGFFLSHRKEIGVQASKSFKHVSLVAPKGETKHETYLLGIDFQLVYAPDYRLHRNPLYFCRGLLHGFRLAMRAKSNDLFHVITMLPIVLYGLPLRCFRRKLICAVAGLGSGFSGQRFPDRLKAMVARFLLRFIFNGQNSRVIVQNHSDYRLLEALGINPANIQMIRGSGVDPQQFVFRKDYCKEPFIILLPARLIKEKGIEDAVAALKILNRKSACYELWLAGEPDPGNPRSFSSDELEKIRNQHSNCKLLGFVEDMADLYLKASVIIQPSRYNEGLPKVIIEAFAIGRPVIAYRNPGSEEILKNQKNGILLEPGDIEGLAASIAALREQPEFYEQLQIEARQEFLSSFTVGQVVQQHMSLYHSF